MSLFHPKVRSTVVPSAQNQDFFKWLKHIKFYKVQSVSLNLYLGLLWAVGHDTGWEQPKAGAQECPAVAPSVDTGNDPVANSSAVLVPRRAVLPPALAHVTGVSMHEQDDEVDHVVPRQEVVEACMNTVKGHGRTMWNLLYYGSQHFKYIKDVK